MPSFLPQKAKLLMTLRAQAIMQPDILSAIETIPREQFIPDSLHAHAYENASLPIGYKQTISQPYIVAVMTQALELKKTHRVLEIGTGSGYQAAILSRLSRRVYTLERLRPLLISAENRLKNMQISNITYRHGDGAKGWPEAAPFDRIILTCGCNKIPDKLLNQLKIGGIMVAPEGVGKTQQLVVVKRQETGFDRKNLMAVTFVPLIEDKQDE